MGKREIIDTGTGWKMYELDDGKVISYAVDNASEPHGYTFDHYHEAWTFLGDKAYPA